VHSGRTLVLLLRVDPYITPEGVGGTVQWRWSDKIWRESPRRSETATGQPMSGPQAPVLCKVAHTNTGWPVSRGAIGEELAHERDFRSVILLPPPCEELVMLDDERLHPLELLMARPRRKVSHEIARLQVDLDIRVVGL